ncbi:MAG: NAD-dependent protein deacylase [Eubacteriales bacterium]|nr:NAD-dependent protein deacylase [Eubacteriales bacterium]
MYEIEKLKSWIDECSSIVFFGGAGVSTESGIPDFRSKDGLYNQHDIRFDKYQPEYLLSHTCLIREPAVYFEFHRQKMDTRNVEPNDAHKYLAKLEEMGKLSAIVTQNIDGLHQKAGSKKVYEIHGKAYKNYCMSCGKDYADDYIFESAEPIPRCTKCGGVIRPAITLYEESLPEEDVELSIRAIRKADMLIIGGTSLAVYPAASFINYFNGKYLVVMNRSRLSHSVHSENELQINKNIGEAFRELAALQGITL